MNARRKVDGRAFDSGGVGLRRRRDSAGVVAPEVAESNLFRGRILVSYPVGWRGFPRIKRDIEKLFWPEPTKEEDRDRLLWDKPVGRWLERDPAKRLDLFKQALGGNWHNPDQEPILQSMVSDIIVEVHEGDLLPFRMLLVQFGITLSKDPRVPNHPKNLIFLAQKCRDLMDKLLRNPGRGRGEIVVATSELLSEERLQALRDDVRLLATSRAVWDGEASDATGLLRVGPPGYHPGYGGFSHFLVSRNLHAVLAPLAGSDRGGPGWVVHFYEQAGLEGSHQWESGALQLLDPVGKMQFTGYVENRVSGLPLLLALSAWTSRENHESREQRQDLLAEERTLGAWLMSPRLWFAWGRLSGRSRDARVRVYELQAVRDEYEATMTDFLTRLREEEQVLEVWVPTQGFPEVAPERRRIQGPLYRLVQEVAKDFRAVETFAAATYDQAKAQHESFKVRVERVIALALLVIAVVQTVDILPRVISWLLSIDWPF